MDSLKINMHLQPDGYDAEDDRVFSESDEAAVTMAATLSLDVTTWEDLGHPTVLAMTLDRVDG